MKPARQQIQEYILQILESLSQDWDYSTAVGPDTLMVSELGFESLDLVVLGTAVQEHYQVQMPFAEFLALIGQREQKDVSVAELVDFVSRNLGIETIVASNRQ